MNDTSFTRNGFLPTAREGNVFTGVCLSTIGILVHCSALLRCSWYASYWNAFSFKKKTTRYCLALCQCLTNVQLIIYFYYKIGYRVYLRRDSGTGVQTTIFFAELFKNPVKSRICIASEGMQRLNVSHHFIYDLYLKNIWMRTWPSCQNVTMQFSSFK